MTTHENDEGGAVMYSRTTVLPDGTQQIEHFHLSPLQQAFVNRVLGDPHTISLVTADQAEIARREMGTYARLDMRD